jgi:hypothetical protein
MRGKEWYRMTGTSKHPLPSKADQQISLEIYSEHDQLEKKTYSLSTGLQRIQSKLTIRKEKNISLDGGDSDSIHHLSSNHRVHYFSPMHITTKY